MDNPEMGGGDHIRVNDRISLLDRMKHRYEAWPLRPVLCQSMRTQTWPPSKKAAPLSYTWMFYAGTGQETFKGAESYETAAAEALLKAGQIALSQRPSYAFNGLQHRPLSLIEDINWGMKSDGSTVIFNLTPEAGFPDSIISADEKYDAALAEIKKRIERGDACHDNPLRLTDGTEVTPIIFGRERVALSARQNLLPRAP